MGLWGWADTGLGKTCGPGQQLGLENLKIKVSMTGLMMSSGADDAHKEFKII